jgi:hypothetical protein
MAEFIFPLPYIPDPSQGRPLSNGSLYFGLPDLDPEVPGNQIPVSVIQENGIVVPVMQPIMTGAGGVPIYNGSPVEISVSASEYSFKALNNQEGQVYFIPRVEENLEQQVADLEQRVDDLEQDVSDLEQEDIAIRATQGVALGAVNLGTFPGSLIPNNQSVKSALTILEDEAQDVRTLTGTPLGATNLGSFGATGLPSGQNLKVTLETFADYVNEGVFSALTPSATATTNDGEIQIPYGASNAIVIKWGRHTHNGDGTIVTTNFSNPLTAAFSAVGNYFGAQDKEDSGGVFSFGTTSLSTQSGEPGTTFIHWLAVGRRAI